MCCQALLKDGVNVDASKGGYTALMYAGRDNRGDVVDILMEAGADPNAPPSDTPLDAAVQKGHEGTAAVLMEVRSSEIARDYPRRCAAAGEFPRLPAHYPTF